MSLPILYSFRRCPFAIRARMGLWSAGVDVELREVVLRDKPASMLEASPKGTVPVLILDDGSVIDESLDIMLWALGRNDPEGWLDIEPDAQTALIHDCQNRFKPHLDRYKYTARYDDANKEAEAAKALEWLTELSERLEGHDWLFANRIQLADIAIFPFVRQFAHADTEFFSEETSEALQDWLERAKALPVFKSTFKKFKQWHPGDEEFVFGPGA